MDLVEFRKMKGLTSYALADKSGISRTSISRVEQGLTKVDNFTMGNAKKLADFLEITLDELYFLIVNIIPTHQVGNKLGCNGLSKLYDKVKEVTK